jgi:hypothetical protein
MVRRWGVAVKRSMYVPFPRVAGVLPAITGVLPAITGVLPAITGVLPAITGVLPAITGVLTATTVQFPRKFLRRSMLPPLCITIMLPMMLSASVRKRITRPLKPKIGAETMIGLIGCEVAANIMRRREIRTVIRWLRAITQAQSRVNPKLKGGTSAKHFAD